MWLKLGIDFAAGYGPMGGRAFPPAHSLPAIRFLLQQFDTGPQHTNLALDPEPPFEQFDPALVLFLDHQRLAHIYLQIRLNVYQSYDAMRNA
jgi:hypothetical protein